MGGLEEYGGKIGWKLIGWINERTACQSSGLSSDELMRYGERIPFDLRFRNYES